jgi:hypothetical protein
MNNIKCLLIALLFGASASTYAQSAIEPFENWNNYSVLFTPMEEPTGWSGTDSFIVGFGKPTNLLGTYNSQLIKEVPGHTGLSAMKAATKFQDGVSIVGLAAKDYPVIVTNSTILLDAVNGGFTQQGGTPINFRPVSTSMFIKNNVVSGDSTYIQAIIIDDGDGADSIIAVADTAIGVNISSFTQIDLPFVYNGSTLNPTLVRYVISSGNALAIVDSTNTFVAHNGTEIIVDDIDLTAPLGIRQHIYTSKICDVFPTLIKDYLQVNYILNQNQMLELSILSANGQLVKKHALNSENNHFDMTDLSQGTYVYHLSKDNNGSRQIVQSGKLQKQ